MNSLLKTNISGNMTDPVFGETPPLNVRLSVFNTEYRILQKMKRLQAGFYATGRCNGQTVMRELLTSANGAAAYDVPLAILLNHLKEYRQGLGESGMPMTLIAWKNTSGYISCSVERIFLIWDDALPLEDNLYSNAYMEQSARVALKLLRENYHPFGIIGKGDYLKTLRTIFADYLGYVLI